MQGINPITGLCTYSTPCGWCAKWDKQCDNKIGCGNEKPPRGLRAKANIYDVDISCSQCAEDDKIFNLCAECGGAPAYKKFRPKEN